MISEWGFFLIKMLYFCSFQKYVFINSVFFFVKKKNLQFLCFFQIFSENFYFGIVQNSLERVTINITLNSTLLNQLLRKFVNFTELHFILRTM